MAERRSILAIAFALMIGTAGCSTTMELAAPPVGTSPARTVIVEEGPKRPARLETTDSVRTVRQLEVTPSGFRFETPWGTTDSLAYEEVSRVEFRSAGKGALEGLGIGLLAGVVAGAALGVAYPDDWSTGDAIVVGIVVVGIFSVPLGTLIGAGFGHRTSIHVRPGR